MSGLSQEYVGDVKVFTRINDALMYAANGNCVDDATRKCLNRMMFIIEEPSPSYIAGKVVMWVTEAFQQGEDVDISVYWVGPEFIEIFINGWYVLRTTGKGGAIEVIAHDEGVTNPVHV